MMIEIQSIVEGNGAGIRKLPGTVLKNDKTGEMVYAPPSSEVEIRKLLSNLESPGTVPGDSVHKYGFLLAVPILGFLRLAIFILKGLFMIYC